MADEIRVRAEIFVFDRNFENIYLGFDKDGFVEMPGGGKKSNEDEFEAAKRETLEEIGVMVGSMVKEFDPIKIVTDKWTSIIKSFVCLYAGKDEEQWGDGPEGKLKRKKLPIKEAISEFERRLREYPDLNKYGELLTKYHISILKKFL